jgi:hypothetical protein
MNKIITAICLSIVLSISVFAQTQAQTLTEDDKNNPPVGKSTREIINQPRVVLSSEYNKNEFYVGYSNQQIDTFGRTTFHGIQGAYTRNIHKWFGIRADFSYARSDRTFLFTLNNPAGGTYNVQQQNVRSVTQFLGGIQVKNNASTKRFKPFGFALAGVAVSRNTFKNLACVSSNCPATIPIFNNITFRDTSFSAAFGGGLDIKINDKIDFRAIQADYNPIFQNGTVNDNFRIGIGIIFK